MLDSKQVATSYEVMDDEDISTERLLSMLADEFECDVDDIIQALVSEGIFRSA